MILKQNYMTGADKPAKCQSNRFLLHHVAARMWVQIM